jgi:hypothetical protein
MSASPPQADICIALANVCFVAQAVLQHDIPKCQLQEIERLFRQTRFAQAIGEFIGVGGVSKRQSAKMICVRVSRIDLH